MLRIPRSKAVSGTAGARLTIAVALGLGLLVAASLTTPYAGREGEGRTLKQKGVTVDPHDPNSSWNYWNRTRLPHPQARLEGLSPFADRFHAPIVPRETRGLVATPLGFLSLLDQGALADLPAGLVRAAERALPGRGWLALGPNLVQVEEEAIGARGLQAIEADLRQAGRVAGILPERAFLVRIGSRQGLDRLAALPYIEAAAPYQPAFKIDLALGRAPLTQAARARSRTLELLVAAWPGAGPEEIAALRRDVEALLPPGAVADHSGDGTVLAVRADAARVPALARLHAVQRIQEAPEFMTYNAEAPSLIMTGSAEDTLGARPYQDIGLDGGGIDTNLDGQRLNDGSDAVPPQIVAVTDNGLSYDSAQFAQTGSQPETSDNPIGPRHRKVHGVQSVADDGQTCDSILHGSGTHGNVVAGAIAGNPSALGVYASKTILFGEPVIRNLPMDGVARGARILMQDAAAPTRCTVDEIIEKGGNLQPGNLSLRLQLARDAGPGVRLHVMPFGIPNFDTLLNNPQNGTYPIEAAQIDTFLVNNRDYMVFAPVGSQGSSPGDITRRIYPDLFDGTGADNDPNEPSLPQIPPPATAKNLVSVGGHREDMQTYAGTTNTEENAVPWGSRGPATSMSLRTAPIITSVAEDFGGLFGAPGIGGVAVFRSRDDDNLAPVEAQLDELNFGTSYAAAYATGAAAIVRDYFAQGFYPTAGRVAADRMPNVSGALVKAALVASANFLEAIPASAYPTSDDRVLGQTRAAPLVVKGVDVGVIGNNEQGYGRVQLANVLPIPNWPPARPIGAPNTLEHPASGLIVFDDVGTGEPPIDNAANTVATHTFRVDSPATTLLPGGGRAVAIGTLRVALAWPDPPGEAGGGGLLINDLDLEVESPGPDNDLATAADNVVYDGNVYVAGAGARPGQWSRGRGPAEPASRDRRNPVEAVHLSSAPEDVNGAVLPSQLLVGTWRVSVKRGAGGAAAGRISAIDGAPPEDANGNFRLDAGEDRDADGLLDAGGQPFALVIAGPVLGAEPQSWGGAAHAFPASDIHLNRATYGCADDLRVDLFDPDAAAADLPAAVTLTVMSVRGVLLDTESGFAFTETPPGSHGFRSAVVPVRQAAPTAVPNNGVLEVDTGQFVIASYADQPVAGEARATVLCEPSLSEGVLEVFDANDGPALWSGGCDRDQYPDAGETLAYTVAVVNTSRGDDYPDVTAALAPSGPGAPAVRVLDSPKPIGRLPGGQATGIGFTLVIDEAALNALPVASRKVNLVLTLDSTLRSKVLSRQSFTFTHAMNADREAFHYSTDFPAGGREVRDLNRNLQVDQADILDPFTGIEIPDEDVLFSTLFFSDAGVVRNTVGEDLNRNNTLDTGEDLIPNGVLDRGILGSPAGPSAGDRVPFNFDAGDGGFVPLRHPASETGVQSAAVIWEHRRNGLCGFQSARPDGNATALFQNDGAGVWHTGDGDPATPLATSTGCDDYAVPQNPATPPAAEFLYDVLTSPIIAKVRQTPDSRGFPYSVEFQRLAVNLTHQTADEFAGGSLNLDSDIESDDRNCLLCQIFYPRFGGGYYVVARFNTYYYGVDPLGRDNVKQRTFGRLVDPDGSVASGVISGDETGFSGFTTNANPSSSSPIPTAPPDFLPYPALTPEGSAPALPGLCAGGTRAGQTCSSIEPACGGGTCLLAGDTVAGPTRNLDLSLVNYNDGQVYLETGPGAYELGGFFTPGTAGNRWQFGVGFFAIESPSQRGDFGLAVDDPILEWDEVHPLDEGQFNPPRTPACRRYGQPGQAAGQKCATLVVDRTTLYECDEAIGVTVSDARRAGAGSITVYAASESDSTRISTGVVTALHPRKSFPIPEVAPGLFRGTITLTGQVDNPGTLFVRPAADRSVAIYYLDPECDGDADGQTGEMTFANLDGDGIPSGLDVCPQVYDPAQPDRDGDGRGDFCDNCPDVRNPDQFDGDGDQVGLLCDLDDVDFDGVGNDLDNCPDVYNPLQTPVSTQNPKGVACNHTIDRDGDGVQDKNDNCVRTANADQSDLDQDRLGDRCDGDCGNAGRAVLGGVRGACNRSGEVACDSNADCPSTGTCSLTTARVCTGDNQCPRTETCKNIGAEVCVKDGIVNDGVCSRQNDDGDVDAVPDAVDNCPTVYNAPIIPGTFRQLDRDRDGLGEDCDPFGSWDDDNSGIPDDAVSYLLEVNCRVVPLARLVVKAVEVGDPVLDVNGDHDNFPDSGETAWIYITVQNTSSLDLTNVSLNLSSSDPDVACITRPSVFLAALPAGATVEVGSLGPDRKAGTTDDRGQSFEVVTSPALQSPSGTNPAALDLNLTLTSSEVLGTDVDVPIRVVGDVDLPPGVEQVRIPGPDGERGTADDGLWFEDFDTDRDDDGVITIDSRPFGTAGVLNDTLGVWVRTSQGGVGGLSYIACGGFNVPPQDPGCIIDPDNDMGWHIHCPAGECPAGFQQVTPPDGAMAFGGRNSLHWGHHLNSTTRAADTTKFRQLAAFMTNPINLALITQAGDLQLSFFHIVSLMSNDAGLNVSHDWAFDTADVQVQVDRDPDPARDDFGVWDRLVPYENVYDHTVMAWSVFGASITYCEFTPADTGTAPPAPRQVHETMCHPSRVWSNCGWALDRTTTKECPGPGHAGSLGTGNWVETRFDLSNFLGQRVRIRWVGQSWEYNPTASSYQEEGGTWANDPHDDGWWLDNIAIAGAVETQVTAVVDNRTPLPGACPAICNPAVADHGTQAVLVLRDANGDGLLERGEQLALDASGSSLPGGCVGGVAQYRFEKNGQAAQDWSANNTWRDAPLLDASYRLLVRCSADFTCTGTAGAGASVQVYTGDGQDIVLSVARGAGGATVLSWPRRPQPTSASGYDLFRGVLDGVSRDAGLATLACLRGDLSQPDPGGSVSVEDTDPPPAAGTAFYYLAGHSSRAAGAFDALGRRSDGTIRIAPVACP